MTSRVWEGFLIDVGCNIVIPAEAIEFFGRSCHADDPPSKHDGEHLKTPVVARLWPCSGDSGKFRFAHHKDVPSTQKGSSEFCVTGPRVGGLVMFLPKNLRPGDVVKVQWRDCRSARAVKIGE